MLFCRARKNGCNGRLNKPNNIDDEQNFKLTGQHLHQPDARLVGKKKAMEKLKHLSKTEPDKNSTTVVDESLSDTKRATIAQMPSKNQMLRNVNRYRQKPDAPKNPKTVWELNLTDEYVQTKKGDKFILYDSGAIEQLDSRIIMFGSNENLQLLEACTEIYMDGTFKVAPPLFNQLYTIHGKQLLFSN